MSTRRDTTRDGLSNKFEYFVLSSFGPVWRLIQRNRSLQRLTNRLLIDRAVNKARNRPHPMSLRHPGYTSWESLTDRSFIGRHLPPAKDSYMSSLPPVGKVAELFRRPAGNQVLSSTTTQLFSHFAQWFTDGFLRTDRRDLRKNTSNHEIDLSPLYGRKRSITSALRVMQGGMLKSQFINGWEFPPCYFDRDGKPKREFADVEMFIPSYLPDDRKESCFAMGVERANVQFGYVMLNTLFLREHNRICRLLREKQGTWTDERLFQTARNVVTVLLIKIVVEEYINHLSPYHFKFRADPAVSYQAKWNRTNWMTLEFNLLYRWHGFVTDTVRIGERDYSIEETFFNNLLLVDRGLGHCVDDSSRSRCGRIGLFNTHDSLMDTELASLEISRAAWLQSYNSYRQYVGYPRVNSFAQITGDPIRQEALADVYGKPEDVEFYTGLFSEDTRPGTPLSSLIGRLVAIDAFSQAMTNPLLSKHVFNKSTFSAVGWEIINETESLGDIVRRNLQGEGCEPLVSFDAQSD